jgi:Tfp pilus assembly protein PilO
VRLKARELIFVALLFAIPVGMWKMVFTPRQVSEQTQTAEITEKEEVMKQLEITASAAIKNAEDETEMLEEVVAKMRDRLPEKNDLDAVLQGLSLQAKVNGLVLTNSQGISSKMTPVKLKLGQKPPPPKRFLKSYRSMDVEGPFLGFYSFLQSLERSSTIIRVVELRISKDRREEIDGDVKISMKLVLYYRNPALKKEGKKWLK